MKSLPIWPYFCSKEKPQAAQLVPWWAMQARCASGVLFVAVHFHPGDRVPRVGAGAGMCGVRARRRPEVTPQGPDDCFLGRLNGQPGGIITVPRDPGQRLRQNVDGDLLAGRQERIKRHLHGHRGRLRNGPARSRRVLDAGSVLGREHDAVADKSPAVVTLQQQPGVRARGDARRGLPTLQRSRCSPVAATWSTAAA